MKRFRDWKTEQTVDSIRDALPVDDKVEMDDIIKRAWLTSQGVTHNLIRSQIHTVVEGWDGAAPLKLLIKDVEGEPVFAVQQGTLLNTANCIAFYVCHQKPVDSTFVANSLLRQLQNYER